MISPADAANGSIESIFATLHSVNKKLYFDEVELVGQVLISRSIPEHEGAVG